MSESLQHDDLLFNMLKECKTLPTFLDHIFGFLNRRTDFYFEATDSKSPVGLPKGLAEHLVRNTYFKWKPVSKKEDTEEQVFLSESDVPQVVAEEVVVTSHEVDEQELINSIDNIHIDESPESKEKPKVNPLFSPPEYYNGSMVDNYCWSQSIVDLDISIHIPENSSAKSLEVTILPQRLTVKFKENVLLDGELCQKCKYNDVVWSVDGRKLLIHLDKCKEMWWDCLLTSEERLDLSKVDCSRPFEELPEEAQSKIEELAWNQERKMLGLSNPNERSKEELLRKAWNAEGSPFSGPFDSSQVVFQ